MLLRRYLALCALVAMTLGSLCGCESLSHLNRWDGPSDAHTNFSVRDDVPDDWRYDGESNDGCRGY